MPVSKGSEHVETALKLVRSASSTIGRLDGVEEGWKTEAVARLAASEALLSATADRFFLKTKVCLPFARKCEETASAMNALLAETSAQPAADAQQRLTVALEALEKAARTLDERSQMRGMAIT